jgi:hypothetical protein
VPPPAASSCLHPPVLVWSVPAPPAVRLRLQALRTCIRLRRNSVFHRLPFRCRRRRPAAAAEPTAMLTSAQSPEVPADLPFPGTGRVHWTFKKSTHAHTHALIDGVIGHGCRLSGGRCHRILGRALCEAFFGVLYVPANWGRGRGAGEPRIQQIGDRGRGSGCPRPGLRAQAIPG